MDTRTMKTILEIGETIAVEFKRCGNGIESDVYETVCSFLNRFGGDIFLGVLDDGTVSGVPEKQAKQPLPILHAAQKILLAVLVILHCFHRLFISILRFWIMKGRNSFIYTFFQVQKCTATKK